MKILSFNCKPFALTDNCRLFFFLLGLDDEKSMKVLFEMPKYRQNILGFVALGQVFTSPRYGLSVFKQAHNTLASVPISSSFRFSQVHFNSKKHRALRELASRSGFCSGARASARAEEHAHSRSPVAIR